MKCRICNNNSKFIFNSKILNKYEIKYFQCPNCDFIQTEEPYWLDEAYSESINVSDTGYMQRNINFSKKITILLALFFNKDAKFLDFAAGYGVFVRLMRDIGFDFYWDDKFSKNLFARGFEYDNNSEYEVVTSFESFEHFVNPIEEIDKLLSISKNIILSTELIPLNTPSPKDWWYYGLDHGQHISFYNEKTFYFIANKYNLKYTNLGSLHVLSEKQIPSYFRILLKFTKFGLHRLFLKRLKSKVWDDYYLVGGKNENTI